MKLPKVCAALLIIVVFFLISSAFWWYAHERSKPGGDAVRQAWLKRRSCSAEAKVCYDRCIGRANDTSP
uniref:Uncharacterized protein n=1 Tax=viral metagenome TaxID=1070528 RepID=A0A6M3XSE1_9ZZZZ